MPNTKEILAKHKKKKSFESDKQMEILAESLVTGAIKPFVLEFNKKIEDAVSELKNKIDTVQQDITQEIEETEDELKSKIGSTEEQINGKANSSEKGLKGQIDTHITDNKVDHTAIRNEMGVAVSDVKKDFKKKLKAIELLPGKDGVDGKGGKDGKDGIEIKPLEVAEKLNTLEEKVDFKVIKGLGKMLENLRRSIREGKRLGGSGGGGMGNFVNQQFDGDGATTQFTLSSNVANSGNAVIGVRYEGQMQYLGDQFTISGKTLTMLFTPEADTKIEITYIRS